MQINRKQLYVRYRQIRKELRYTHTKAIKALARVYRVSPIAIAFELSLAKTGDSPSDSDSDSASDVVYNVMTENPFNVY